MLASLVQRPGQLITREELQRSIWQADTFVDFDHGLNRAINKVREALDDSAETPRFIETVPRRGYRFIAPVHAPEAMAVPPPRHLPRPGLFVAGFIEAATPRFKSIAVLPLEDLSHDPAQAYFADGMTDELITELARVGSLNVISRTSVQRYKGSHASLQTQARELHADAIVEGTVLRTGSRVRVTAQLIDAARDVHVWAQSYERELGDVLLLQQQVALDIAGHVSASLTPAEQHRFATSRSINPEAWDSYLKGRFFWNQRTTESDHQAISYFERAIEEEPRFAQAYAGLSEAYTVLAWDEGTVPPGDAFQKGKTAALKALEIDPLVAEAHASLGWEKLFGEWDWTGAERELLSAIHLSPSYGTAHHHYSRLLALTGRFDEALRESLRALQIDPMDPIAGGNLAWNSYLARRYDQSIKQSQRMLEMFPSMPGFHTFLGWNYDAEGNYPEAIRAFRDAVATGDSTGESAQLGYSYALSGNRQAAKRILNQLQQTVGKEYVPPYNVALIYIGLRNPDQAFKRLNKAYAERSPYLVNLKVDPSLDPIRSDAVSRYGAPCRIPINPRNERAHHAIDTRESARDLHDLGVGVFGLDLSPPVVFAEIARGSTTRIRDHRGGGSGD